MVTIHGPLGYGPSTLPLRWRLSKFWKLWQDQYLLNLRETHTQKHKSRGSWFEHPPSVCDLVLIGEKDTSRVQWKKARIQTLLKSKDKAVRSAELILPTGKKCIRAISQLYPIESSFLNVTTLPVKTTSQTFFIAPSFLSVEESTSSFALTSMTEFTDTEIWVKGTPTADESFEKDLEKLTLHQEDPMETSEKGGSNQSKVDPLSLYRILPTSGTDETAKTKKGKKKSPGIASWFKRTTQSPTQRAAEGKRIKAGSPESDVETRKGKWEWTEEFQETFLLPLQEGGTSHSGLLQQKRARTTSKRGQECPQLQAVSFK